MDGKRALHEEVKAVEAVKAADAVKAAEADKATRAVVLAAQKALFDAVRQRNPSLVRKIINTGPIYINCGREETPLHWAASLGSLEIVKILVEEGHAEIEFRNKSGKYPHNEAARNNHIDIVKYLTELGRDRKLLLDAVRQKNTSLVRSLIKSSPSLVGHQYVMCCGGTVLHVAADVGALEIVKIIVEEGHAEISLEDENGETPKELAARMHHVDVVQYLAKAGCTVDVEFYMALHGGDNEGWNTIVVDTYLA